MQLGIVIITYNLDSRVFNLQIETIKKFCKDDNYDILVYDNSDDESLSAGIKHHAESTFLVKYTRTNAGTRDFSRSHAFAASLSYGFIRNSYDYLLYLDHDCIPIKAFSVKEILGDKIIAGLGQSSGENTYFWPGCVMWNNNKIDRDSIDFYPVDNLDTGAGFRKVIKKHGIENCIFFNEIYHGNPHFTTGNYNYYTMINNGMFMHFINSSNWNPTNNNEDRINSLLNIAQEKRDEYSR